MKIGQIVYSKAGRDKGYALAVIAISPKGVFAVDGKKRPLIILNNIHPITSSCNRLLSERGRIPFKQGFEVFAERVSI